MRPARIRLAQWCLALITVIVCAGGAYAAREATGSSVTLPRDAIVDEDLHAAGRVVQIGARVRGDVAAAGENVSLTGPVQGYVMAAGADVGVSGPVGDDLWAAGGTVTVGAPIGDNAMLAGGTVVLQPAASIGRDAQIAGNSVEVRGRIGRDLKLAAANARLGSEVRGSVEAHVERLSLEPGALVRGNLVVYSPVAPQISPEARVLGHVDYHQTTARPRRSGGSWVGWWVFRFLSLLIIGSVFIALSPVWTDRVAGTISRQPGESILAGVAGLILVPMAVVPLFVTVIGIPLALLLIALYSVGLLLAGVFVAYLIGGGVMSRFGNPGASPYARLAVGAVILSLVLALPVIGWITRVAVALFGFGGLVLERWDLLRRLRAQGLA